jgi:hypothetical protein
MTAGLCWPMFDNAFESETVLLRMATVEVYTASHFTRALQRNTNLSYMATPRFTYHIQLSSEKLEDVF